MTRQISVARQTASIADIYVYALIEKNPNKFDAISIDIVITKFTRVVCVFYSYFMPSLIWVWVCIRAGLNIAANQHDWRQSMEVGKNDGVIYLPEMPKYGFEINKLNFCLSEKIHILRY